MWNIQNCRRRPRMIFGKFYSKSGKLGKTGKSYSASEATDRPQGPDMRCIAHAHKIDHISKPDHYACKVDKFFSETHETLK